MSFNALFSMQILHAMTTLFYFIFNQILNLGLVFTLLCIMKSSILNKVIVQQNVGILYQIFHLFYSSQNRFYSKKSDPNLESIHWS